MATLARFFSPSQFGDNFLKHPLGSYLVGLVLTAVKGIAKVSVGDCEPDWNVKSDSLYWQIDGQTPIRWSKDKTAFYLGRSNGGELPPNTFIKLTIAPKGDPGFRDLKGNPAKQYKLKFRTQKQ